jgi:hypothetical protein
MLYHPVHLYLRFVLCLDAAVSQIVSVHDGETILHKAASSGSLSTVRVCLDAGIFYMQFIFMFIIWFNHCSFLILFTSYWEWREFDTLQA